MHCCNAKNKQTALEHQHGYHGDDVVEAACGINVVTGVLYHWSTDRQTDRQTDTQTHTHTYQQYNQPS